MININRLITELVEYSERKGLIDAADRPYAVNSLLALLRVSDYEPAVTYGQREISDILSDITDYAIDCGIVEQDGTVHRDLFDTAVMGVMVDRPSAVTKRFYELYGKDPVSATDYFYSLACDSNYIRLDRIKRDLKWRAKSKYGEMDITVNLSKPEKDPKAIEAAKLLPPSGYPKCLLCHENEGYAGNAAKPARQNLRQIPFDMAGARWYLQYSPYVYYNEHCIALSAEHAPMRIDRSTFEKLLGFVEKFPHYFMGSNADLPIVGGSILSHDHMQGGRYTFAMERAKIKTPIEFSEYSDISCGILEWPMSVIRISSKGKESLVDLASKILDGWREYSDPSVGIYAETCGEPHNTVTPIARMRNGRFELDIVLRNNLTTAEHPLGVFHPHAEYHNIKKENIGLIEVMGLAVLPARLKDEIAAMCDAILSGADFSESETTAKHKEWFLAFASDYEFTAENTEDILKAEIGKTFVRVLSDAGVYKDTPRGLEAFMGFINSVGGRKKQKRDCRI